MKLRFSLIVFILLFFPSLVFCDHSYFNKIKKRLVKDGFDKKVIENIYKPANINFEFDSVTLFFTISEYKLNYAQFLNNKNVQKGRAYIKKYKDVFDASKKKYGVPPQVITAILTVETRLGTFTGKRPVLSSLSTIAAMEDNKVKNMVQKSVPSRKNRYSIEKFIKRSDRKASWAYVELKKLIEYSLKYNIDTKKIIGSYAGATGIPQFMPSNIEKYARDGNNDNKIDLLTHEDAIASVANYLKAHGWTNNPKNDIAHKIVMKYNKSRPYASTILKLAKKIRN